MKAYINEFEAYLKEQRKSSNNTLESYLRDVSQFSEYCSNEGIKTVSTIGQQHISSYCDLLHKKGKAVSTITRMLASLRCYFNFLTSIGIAKDNPVSNIRNKKVTKKMPEILTSKEISALLSQPDVSGFKGCRDKAILELLYATGIKVSELINIKTTDINLQIGILNLHSGKSERIIPIYPDAIKTLTNYCINVRNVITDNNINELFINMNGQPLTRQGLWKIIKYYAEKANINKDITPHTIRHSFATHLLENGAPLKDVQEILGHSDLSSTQIYAQLMRNKYAQSYKKYHPMAR